MFIDMHCHSLGSHDSIIKDQWFYTAAVDKIFVTDHNKLHYAMKLREKCPDKIIPGEEINTSEGEVIGLFLEKEIKPGMTMEKTIFEIKEQEGVVYMPHPFDRLRKAVAPIHIIEANIDEIDIIEVFNARAVYRQDNRHAFLYARKNKKLTGAGSDAHTRREMGQAGVKIKAFDNRDAFIENMKEAQIVEKYSPIYVHVVTKIVKRFGKEVIIGGRY